MRRNQDEIVKLIHRIDDHGKTLELLEQDLFEEIAGEDNEEIFVITDRGTFTVMKFSNGRACIQRESDVLDLRTIPTTEAT